MGLRLLTVIGAEPVTLAEAKAVCRVDADITADDAMITGMIKAARGQAEQITCRTIVRAQWERSLDAFPEGGIELAWPTVETINSIAYVDAAGALQTLSSALYTLDGREDPGWAMPAEGADWPATLDTANAVRVTFTARWLEGGTDACPEDIRSWIMMRVATLYKFREHVAAGVSVAELPREHGMGLLDRWVWYG